MCLAKPNLSLSFLRHFHDALPTMRGEMGWVAWGGGGFFFFFCLRSFIGGPVSPLLRFYCIFTTASTSTPEWSPIQVLTMAQVGQAGWGGLSPTPLPVHTLQWAGEVRGNILTLPPLPLHIYNSRFQGYASELVFNQKNENVNKEEE